MWLFRSQSCTKENSQNLMFLLFLKLISHTVFEIDNVIVIFHCLRWPVSPSWCIYDVYYTLCEGLCTICLAWESWWMTPAGNSHRKCEEDRKPPIINSDHGTNMYFLVWLKLTTWLYAIYDSVLGSGIVYLKELTLRAVTGFLTYPCARMLGCELEGRVLNSYFSSTGVCCLTMNYTCPCNMLRLTLFIWPWATEKYSVGLSSLK